jgi:hypothetical protein
MIVFSTGPILLADLTGRNRVEFSQRRCANSTATAPLTRRLQHYSSSVMPLR